MHPLFHTHRTLTYLPSQADALKIAEIRARSAQGGADIYKTVAESIAPEIFGHEDVKKVSFKPYACQSVTFTRLAESIAHAIASSYPCKHTHTHTGTAPLHGGRLHTPVA